MDLEGGGNGRPDDNPNRTGRAASKAEEKHWGRQSGSSRRRRKRRADVDGGGDRGLEMGREGFGRLDDHPATDRSISKVERGGRGRQLGTSRRRTWVDGIVEDLGDSTTTRTGDRSIPRPNGWDRGRRMDRVGGGWFWTDGQDDNGR